MTTETPSTAVSARLELGATGCALAGGFLAAAAGPLTTLGVLGVLLGIGLVAAAAYRPIVATYACLGALPVVAVVDRGDLVPLVRPDEALLALLLAGAMLGGYLRYCRGAAVPFRLHRLDLPLAAFALLSTGWPLVSQLVRGQQPLTTELLAVLPVGTLVAIYLLVRFTVATEAQLVRCLRLILWPGAAAAVVAILTAAPIVTGDHLVVCLVLVLCCGARGLLDRRERLALGLVLGAGVLVVGQLTTWIAAVPAGALILWRFPELRRRAVRFLWVVPIAVIVAALAFPGRRAALPGSYLPEFELLDVLIGASPDPVLAAPAAGYLQLLRVGGLPLLAAFGWLSVAVLRRSREQAGHAGPVGVTASALGICWWFLLVLTVVDPHLTLRGTGLLLVTMLAITTGQLYAETSREGRCGEIGNTIRGNGRSIVQRVQR